MNDETQQPLPQITPYQLLGGETGIRTLVNRFYELMDTLPEAWEIRKLHPDDLSGSREKLFKFLSGWLGGPSLYIQEYGHPMLRRRHLPFPIGDRERDQWMMCMRQTLEEQVADEQLRAQLLDAFQRTADHMRNRM
ncbi:MAG: group II truncated hemoglobin [Gammaproteobacteria bacterium]